MPLAIIQGDITKISAEAIVNAANEQLLAGGGVCGAIFQAAGHSELTKTCQKIGFCPTGQAVMTDAYQLSATHIIHTVGPIYQDGQSGEETLLRSAYLSSLHLAEDSQLTSIAFPLISSGIYGYPKEAAIHVALEVIQDYLKSNALLVYLVIFDQPTFTLAKNMMHA